MKKRWQESDKERLVDSEKWRKGGERERQKVERGSSNRRVKMFLDI